MSAVSNKITESALDAIFHFYRIPSEERAAAKEVLSALENTSETPENEEHLLDAVLDVTGLRCRKVELSPGWRKDSAGALLGFLKNGAQIAMIPSAGGYKYLDPESGRRVRVTGKNEQMILPEAFCFYKCFPNSQLTIRDLAIYQLRCFSFLDIAKIVSAACAVTLLGMLTPLITQALFGPVASSGEKFLFPNMLALLIGTAIAQALIGIIQSLSVSGVESRIEFSVQAAAMERVLELPSTFFREFAPGTLSERLSGIAAVSSQILKIVLGTGLTCVFSLAYLGQIAAIAPALALPSAIIIAINVGVSILITIVQTRLTSRRLKASAQLNGWMYTLIGAVKKIRLSGAEGRAFGIWSEHYRDVWHYTYQGPIWARLSVTISLAVSLFGMIGVYFSAAAAHITPAQYMAFSSAFGMVSGAFMQLTGMVQQISGIRPQMEMCRPLLEAAPEKRQGKKRLDKLTGDIILENVSFSYEPDNPNASLILNDISLHIKPGEYVGIVGRTGCGKSTLLRMLLGFETPQDGRILYDGYDLAQLDVKTARRSIGVVLQESRVFHADIYNNIVIAAPWLGVDEAWKAAEKAGIADDIREMPMGLNTIVSEDSAGISGGQRQRICIARAIVSNPSIIMFDEATSALDNSHQQIVSESLDAMGATRIVIAHRISTIRHCDRILMLDGGHIAEEGTYEELLNRRGLFWELVHRQEL